jgi:hypothetical protein
MGNKSRLHAIVLALLISLFSFALLFAILYEAYLQGSDAMFIAISILGGIFWGWIIYWLYQDGRITFSHIITIWMVFTGTLFLAYSYFLAARQVTETLSDLSKYIAIYVISTPAGYFLKSGIENAIRHLKNKAKTSKEAAEILEEITEPDITPPDISSPDVSLDDNNPIEEDATETDTSEDLPP